VLDASWARQYWVLGALGSLLIVFVSVSAVWTLARTVDAGHELAQLNRAQRLHQDADMMHDALRADVGNARHAAREGLPSAGVRRAAVSHVRRFRGDMDALRDLSLPTDLDAALASLRPAQHAFLADTFQLVEAHLTGRDSTAAAQRFETAFDELATAQEAATGRLADTAAELESAQERQEVIAVRALVLATAVALIGWAALVLAHRRAGTRVAQALRREAEQRAVAELLQRSMLPERLPVVPGVRLAARSLTSDSSVCVGGDWYDAFPLPSGEVGLVVGDVVGHDLQAATTMGQLRAAVRAFAVHERSPAAVLERVNTVADLLDVTDMTTCLYAVVTPATGRVRWSSAGHPNPFVLPANGEVGFVLPGDPGPPLGASLDGGFEDRDLPVGDGTFVLLYTDGLLERRTVSLSDGQRRLASVRGPHADPDGLCEQVLLDMLADDPQTDDVTLLALQA
jgi:serine phosphatase RsbU (regulator of sigma subunit)